MQHLFKDVNKLIDFVNTQEYDKNDTITLTGYRHVKKQDYNVNCNFCWNGLYSEVEDCSFLPTEVNGNLEIESVKMKTMKGFPVLCGNIIMNDFVEVYSWNGFQYTVIDSSLGKKDHSTLTCPTKKLDLEFHPTFLKREKYLKINSLQYMDSIYLLLKLKEELHIKGASVEECLLELLNSNLNNYLEQI